MFNIAKLIVSISTLAVASCSTASIETSVCAVRASPENFLGKDLEISGLAQVYRHGTNLTDQNCPGFALALTSPPNDTEGSDSDKFFYSLAPLMAPGSKPVAVKVHGKLIEQDWIPRYKFIVASGTRSGG